MAVFRQKEHYLKQSPEHKIAVMIRIQDKSNDISHPVCTFDEFVKMMKNGEIRWNELYFVQQ